MPQGAADASDASATFFAVEYELDRPDVFPPGTELHLFVAEAIPHGEIPTKGPIAGALETIVLGGEEVENEETEEMETVVDDKVTAVTFPEVTEARNYLVIGVLPGESKEVRWIRFVPGKMGKSLTPPARFPSHSAG